MAFYGSYTFYQPQGESTSRESAAARLTQQPSSGSVSGVLVSEPLVVENSSAYFEHDQKIMHLEQEIERLKAVSNRFEEDDDEDYSDSPEFDEGDKVEGLYCNRKWISASIAEKRQDGSYVLEWDDGFTQDRLKRAHDLRKAQFPIGIEMKGMEYSKLKNRYEYIEEEAFLSMLDEKTLNYKVGDRVSGLFRNGKWYDATIAEVKTNGMFLLDWDDGDHTDREKMIHQIRSRAQWEEFHTNNFLLLSIHKYKSNDIKGTDKFLDLSSRVVRVDCKTAKLRDHSMCIQYVQFLMADGKTQMCNARIDEKEILSEADLPHSPGLEHLLTFCLQEDEVLTGVEVKHRQKSSRTPGETEHTLMEALRFKTSKNRLSEWFGNLARQTGISMAHTTPANPITGLELDKGGILQAAVLADSSRQMLTCPIFLGPDRFEDPDFSMVMKHIEGKEDERLRIQIEALRERGQTNGLPGNKIYTLELRFKHDASAYTQNDITFSFFADPGIKESFDLVDASDKVITLLSRITMSNKWAKCSSNMYGEESLSTLQLAYLLPKVLSKCKTKLSFDVAVLQPNITSHLNVLGFFIRNILLGGSMFEDQVVPNTQNVLILSTVGVLLAFAMQFALSWYLWSSLPFNQAYVTQNGAARAPLDHVWDPNQDGNPKYSTCRTHPLVQVICIGLFLFYILNSTPAIIKNLLIILWTDHFMSRDINGVTRIHYWRTSSFWSGLAYQVTKLLNRLKLLNKTHVIVPFPMQVIDWKVLRFFRQRGTFYLPLSKRLFPQTMSTHLPADPDDDFYEVKSRDWVHPFDPENPGVDDRRRTYELQETKAFFRRKLAEINMESFAVHEKDEDEQDKDNKRILMEAIGNVSDPSRRRPKEQHKDFDSVAKEIKIIRTTQAANYLVALDYCEGKNLAELRRNQTGYHALFRSIIAVLIGVVPEIIATMMILISGCQYIMWSGSQVGSNTSGLEEIILATVAITFINEIDDALFEHALPELYKTAHDLDEFNLENWIPASEPAEMEDATQKRSLWLPFGKFMCWPKVKGLGTYMRDEKEKYSRPAFVSCMNVGPYYERMSYRKYWDFNFAKQYPFLYARKYKYFFQQHFFEGIIWAYGSLGVHIIVLTGISLGTVGGIRNAHGCSGRLGPFTPVEWPNTCDDYKLATAGICT